MPWDKLTMSMKGTSKQNNAMQMLHYHIVMKPIGEQIQWFSQNLISIANTSGQGLSHKIKDVYVRMHRLKIFCFWTNDTNGFLVFMNHVS